MRAQRGAVAENGANPARGKWGPAEAGRPYLLACSLARKPGWRFAGGAWLRLGFDPLYFLSASGRAPQIFHAFGGVLSTTGRAAAAIQVPSPCPGGLGMGRRRRSGGPPLLRTTLDPTRQDPLTCAAHLR